MKTTTIIFLLFCGVAFAQHRGKVFPQIAKTPTELPSRNGRITVLKSLYGLQFKDPTISEVYKKAVATFFKCNFNPLYKPMKTYNLKIVKKQGYIWVEGKKTIKHS